MDASVTIREVDDMTTFRESAKIGLWLRLALALILAAAIPAFLLWGKAAAH